MPVPSPQPKSRDNCVYFRAGRCARTAFLRPWRGGRREKEGSAVEKHEAELRLSESEKKVIQAMRRVDYGELRVVMRNGKPVQLEATQSEKLDVK